MNIFEMNTKMDAMRQSTMEEKNRHYLDDLYAGFDKTLRVDNYVRKYSPTPLRTIPITPEDVDEAYVALAKYDEEARTFDCGACGSDTCEAMAIKIAKGINVPANCVEKARKDIEKEHRGAISAQTSNLNNLGMILEDVTNIRGKTQNIMLSIGDITTSITSYNRMIADIEKIAMQVNIIAINASIEAARAGVHGKAFGVVAEEIKNLAQSSNASAQQTKSSSVKATDAIESVKELMLQISESINMSYDRIVEIADRTRKLS